MMVLDAQLGWRHAPGLEKVFANEDGKGCLVVTNEFGNRGPAHGPERRPGTYRILVLGDSFTEGVHVGEEELFTALLEQDDPVLEVVNAGVGGYGTVQELLFLREEGRKFDPDLVIKMFYGNDLSDNCMSFSPGLGPRPYARIENGQVSIVEDYTDDEYLEFCPPVPFASFLLRHSYLFYALNERVYQKVWAEELREKHLAKLRSVPDPVRLEIYFALLTRMCDMLVADNTAFAVALIATRDEVQDGHAAYHAEIQRFCVQQGIPVLSLLPAMVESRANSRRPFFEHDIHWTAEGHRVAANDLRRLISQQR